MKLEVTNKNYCAVVVQLKDFVTLPNCDNVKAALIFGQSVIVSNDVQAGAIGLYFPVETALSKEFLGGNNLFRKAEYGNRSGEPGGFFEEHGRVKCMKFRGHKSEGFWIPLEAIGVIAIDYDKELQVGAEFNSINDVEICRKYVPKNTKVPGAPGSKNQAKQAKVEDALVDGQFRFHYDTAQLRRNAHAIQPDTIISVSDKWHGTSVICANVLAKVNYTWFEKACGWFGARLQEHTYAGTAASRRVIKAVGDEAKKGAQHFYKEDIWTMVQNEVKDRIPKGYTVYGEIVGYLPSGSAIQSMKGKDFHYGCAAGEHKLIVYRVTVTNADGKVSELAWKPMLEFCAKYGFESVVELFYGKALDFVLANHPDSDGRDTIDHEGEKSFGELFIEAAAHRYLEKPCKYNRNEVPAEGVVVRIDHLEEAEAYKLKSFLFLAGESTENDKGVADIETAESTEEA